jgi:predicted DNA-binding transcriptional regulator YafY
MRASRLMSIVLLLQVHGRMNAQQLADVLEVTPRTFYRDVEALNAAGIPLYGDAGHGGGYRLLDGFRTRLTGMTRDEAQSLLLVGLPAAAAHIGLGSTVATARLKLLAALPRSMQQQAVGLADRIHFDVPAWYHDGAPVQALRTLVDAVWNQQAVRIHYSRWAQPHQVTRVVEPHGVALKAGHWYLVARHCGHTMRTYRVSRISGLDTLTDSFSRAAGFNLQHYWEQYLLELERRRYQATATVRLTQPAFDQLPHIMEPAVAEAAQRTATATDTPGWVEVTVPIESTQHAVRQFLQLGADVEVVYPPELRQQIADIVHSLSQRYEAGRKSGGS